MADLFGDIENFFDEKLEDSGFLGAGASKAVAQVTCGPVNSRLVELNRRLVELGFNLDELNLIFDCKYDMLVLAGAGCGKTTALTLKIIHDLVDGTLYKCVPLSTPAGVVDTLVPCKVLVSTFLKSGADELKKSFRDWCVKLKLTDVDYSSIVFKTIHAEVYDVLRSLGVKLDLLDNGDSIIRGLMNSFEIRGSHSYGKYATNDEVSDISCAISYARNRLDEKKYQHPILEEYGVDNLMLDTVLRAFKQHRSALGKVDFEDMQEMLLEGLQGNQVIRDFIANRYDYIYVDEFQDTSQLQYEILKYYFACVKQKIVVGDDDQCLIKGTLVMTEAGESKIEDLKVGDCVISGIGDTCSSFMIDAVAEKKVAREIMVIKTESGKEIRGTKEHTCFAIRNSCNDSSSSQRGVSEKCLLTLDLFSSECLSSKDAKKTTLGACTSNKVYANILSNYLHNLGSIVIEGVRCYKFSRVTFSIDAQLRLIKEIMSACNVAGLDLDVERFAEFADNSYLFTSMADIEVGMSIPIVMDGILCDDVVKSVENVYYEGSVYDISIPETRNFVANGVVVHNCIYSWRGSDVDIIVKRFFDDYSPAIKNLSTNYRCGRNILNAVIPSIEKNENRRKKDLKAARDGGIVRVISDGGVDKLMSITRNSLAEGDIGILARTNAGLLVPAMLLELDGQYDFTISKSITLNSKLASQVIGAMDLITKRFSSKTEASLKLFVDRYNGYEVDKLCSILKANKSASLFNIALKDLECSVPHIYGVIKGLREACKQDKVFGYIYLLELMLKVSYVGDSIFASTARDFVYFMKSMIIGHKSLKDMSLEELDTVFNDILPSKLAARSSARNKKSFIKLTTVHEAKGKEWSTVVIWNDVQNSFPNSVGKRELTADEYEEERRVHYIAWTRAKNSLFVFTTKGREGDFLKECALTDADGVQVDTLHLLKNVTKSKQLDAGDSTKVVVDRVLVDKVVRGYIEKTFNELRPTNSHYVDLDLVTNNYSTESLVDKLIDEKCILEYEEFEMLDVVKDLICELSRGLVSF